MVCVPSVKNTRGYPLGGERAAPRPAPRRHRRLLKATSSTEYRASYRAAAVVFCTLTGSSAGPSDGGGLTVVIFSFIYLFFRNVPVRTLKVYVIQGVVEWGYTPVFFGHLGYRENTPAERACACPKLPNTYIYMTCWQDTRSPCRAIAVKERNSESIYVKFLHVCI